MADTWNGDVAANLEAGQATGMTLNKGDVITVVASGSAEWATGKNFGPSGDPDYHPARLTCPDAFVGALIAKIGGQYFPINNGVTGWPAPTSGDLVFLYNDVPGEYGDNKGSFAITVTREQAGKGHYDDIINYITGDNTTWTARWVGDNFLHTPAGPRQGGTEHPDTIIVYLTWDGSPWQASWDPSTRKFKHVPLPSANPPGRVQHEDVIMNYFTWDRSEWTAVRDGNGFYHTPA